MIEGWNAFVKYDDVIGNSYEYVLNDEDILSELKEYGLAIKGQKASVATVELLSLQDATNGINKIAVDHQIDLNQPVEIFDLSGKRVSNMNAHGIYLLRQGGKTIKVAK